MKLSHGSLIKMQFLHKWKWISTSCYLALASLGFYLKKNGQSCKSHLSGNGCFGGNWGKICLIVVERFVFLGMSLCGQKYWATHLWLQVLSLPQMYSIKNTDMQSAFRHLWKDGSFWRAQSVECGAVTGCHLCSKPVCEMSFLVDIPPSTVSGAVKKSLLGLQT